MINLDAESAWKIKVLRRDITTSTKATHSSCQVLGKLSLSEVWAIICNQMISRHIRNLTVMSAISAERVSKRRWVTVDTYAWDVGLIQTSRVTMLMFASRVCRSC